MRRPPVPQLVLYLLVGCLTIAVIVGASTSGAAFGAYNPAWDGTADFRGIAAANSDTTVTLGTDPYTQQPPAETIAVVLAPTDSYSGTETAAIRQFVREGGTLLVADNFGSTTQAPPEGNTLLAAVGATARFNGALLRDEREYDRSPALPIAGAVSTHPYTQDVSQLTLNYGTAVEPDSADPLVRTSSFAYLDRNRSGSLDANETLQQYPVVTIESVGDGQVIAVGDPSIFINSMLDRGDNEQFAAALFQAHEQTILDYSSSSENPPLAVILLIFQNTPIVQALVGAIGVGAVWGVTAHRPVWPHVRNRLAALLPATLRQYFLEEETTTPPVHQTPPLTEAELIAHLQQRYPEWDEDRVRQVVAGIIQEEDRDDANE